MRTMYRHYSVRYLCALFGKSRQAYYELGDSIEARALQDTLVLKMVAEVRLELAKAGVPKLQHMLVESFEAHGIKMGRDGLYNLLSTHGLLVRKRKRKPRTTDSDHPYRKYPNLIKEMILTGPGQLWVSDITYLRLPKGFCYLSIVTDAYSRKFVGYKLHPTLESTGATDALNMAVQDHKKGAGLIHHSDRGVQYCCGDYVRMLEHHYIRISMTENGDPYENALAERVNGILKDEFSLDQTFGSFAAATATVAQAVHRYNHIRPHASCDYKTPVMAHEESGVLKMRWKPGKGRKKKEAEQVDAVPVTALSP